MTALAIATALSAAVSAAVVSARYLERLPHIEDEFAYLWQAHVMEEGQISQPSPAEPASFLVPFVVDYNGLRFSKYPPGWPAALALGTLVGAAWLVNPILAGVACWLTYRLGEKLSGPGVGVLAAALTAASPMFLMLSGSLLSHTFAVTLTLVLTLAWMDLVGPGRAGAVPAPLLTVLVGASAGLLFLARPLTAVAVGIPFGLHSVYLMAAHPNLRGKLAAAACLAAGIGALQLLWQWQLTGEAFKSLYTLWWPYDRVGFGPGIGVLEQGHTPLQAWLNTRHSLAAGLHDTFGWPYLSWLFFPIGLWSLRRTRTAWLAAAAIPSLVLVYSAYWIGAWLLGPRYYVEGLPAFAVISAAGFVNLGGWGRAHVPAARKLAVTALLALLFAINLLGYLPVRLAGLHGLYGIARDRLAPLQQAELGDALVLVRSDHWSDYGNVLVLNPPFEDSPLRVALLRGTGADKRLLDRFADRPRYLFDPDQPHLLLKLIRTSSD